MPELSYIAEDLRPLATPLGDLYEDPANARTHNERNLDSITASLKRFGQRKPIVAAPDGRIIAGNGTFRGAKALGWSHLAVTRFDGDPSDLAAYAIADNRTAELAAWDQEALADQLKAFGDDDQLWAAGYSRKELEDLLDAVEPDFVPATRDDQSDLDAPPHMLTCPHCGESFTADEARG